MSSLFERGSAAAGRGRTPEKVTTKDRNDRIRKCGPQKTRKTRKVGEEAVGMAKWRGV
jgi:hypothetical protein